MESKPILFGSAPKTSTFTKNTNRKYFGAPSNDSDMKKSSILFNTHKDQTPTTTHSSFANRPIKYTTAEEPLATTCEEEMPMTRNKSNTMYSSMFVGKADTWKSSSPSLRTDQYKELNDKADELKKRLLEMADKKEQKNPKQDLLNKYLKPTSTPTEITGINPFSKGRKEDDSYAKDFTDFGKFAGILKPAKRQTQISYSPPPQSLGLHPQPTTSYQSIESTFKKQNPYVEPPKPFSPSQTFPQNQYTSSQRQEQRKLRKEDFDIGKKLGNGMFGEVFLVRHKTLKFVCALKILKKEMVRQQKVEDQLVRQIKIQFYLHNQNVISLYGFFCDNECAYLLQELCMDGHLFSMLKEKHRFEDLEAAAIIKQVCQGLDYIHRERIIHRDIKPENIIMHQGVAKICDFGWAVFRGDGLRGTFCGTPLYTPPELLRGEMYDQKFDIWAIGILAYQLIVGRFPFKIFCEDDIKRILTDEITFPFSVDVSPDAKNFILSIIRKDPRDRIEIDSILTHPFLRKSSTSIMEIDLKI